MLGLYNNIPLALSVKYLDNIIKLLSASISSVLIAVITMLHFGNKNHNLASFGIGSSIVVLSCYLYALHTSSAKKQQEYIPLDNPKSSTEALDPSTTVDSSTIEIINNPEAADSSTAYTPSIKTLGLMLIPVICLGLTAQTLVANSSAWAPQNPPN